MTEKRMEEKLKIAANQCLAGLDRMPSQEKEILTALHTGEQSFFSAHGSFAATKRPGINRPSFRAALIAASLLLAIACPYLLHQYTRQFTPMDQVTSTAPEISDFLSAIAQPPDAPADQETEIDIVRQILDLALSGDWNVAGVERLAASLGLKEEIPEQETGEDASVRQYAWPVHVTLRVRFDSAGTIEAANLFVDGSVQNTDDGVLYTNEGMYKMITEKMAQATALAEPEVPLSVGFEHFQSWAVHGTTIALIEDDQGSPYHNGAIWLIIKRQTGTSN